MRERIQTENNTIDLLEVARYLLTKAVYIIMCACICGVLSFGYSTRYITPMYSASINMIVNANSDATTMVQISDVNSAANLVDTYAVIIKSNRVLDKVIENLGLDMSWSQLNQFVSVSAINETSVMGITVRDTDPDRAMAIAKEISEVAPAILVNAVKAGSCEVVSDAFSTYTPISPNVRSNTYKGILAGAVFAAGIFVAAYLLRNKATSSEQLQKLLDVPVLGIIPEVNSSHHKSSHRRSRR